MVVRQRVLDGRPWSPLTRRRRGDVAGARCLPRASLFLPTPIPCPLASFLSFSSPQTLDNCRDGRAGCGQAFGKASKRRGRAYVRQRYPLPRSTVHTPTHSPIISGHLDVVPWRRRRRPWRRGAAWGVEEQKLSAAASSAPSAMAVWCIPSLSDDGVQEAIEREAPRLPQVLNPATRWFPPSHLKKSILPLTIPFLLYLMCDVWICRLLMYCKNVDAMSRGE
jgi:hypothetical protein